LVINGRPLKHQTMNSVAQHKIGVAEIFHLFKDDFLKLYPQPAEHHQVMHLIQACRTAKLGGHLQTCDHCNFSKPMYNSCRCRMCPQCQSLKKERWVSARKNELLPCSYLHGVFTLPHEINILASRNKDIIYKTWVDEPVLEIEGLIPDGAILGCYTAAKNILSEPPADYSKVYFYFDEDKLDIVKKRYPPAKGNNNLFVLKTYSKQIDYGNITTLPQTFVDLWNLSDWYAKDFLTAMERRIDGILS